MFTPHSRIRMQHSIHDIVLLELWLLNEPEISDDDALEAFGRLQARFLVVNQLLYPHEEEREHG